MEHETQDGDLSTIRAFVLLRYTLIAATAYLLIVEEAFGMPPLSAILPVVVALASNVAIAQIPPTFVGSPYFGPGLIIGDTIWITIALVESGHFAGEFFYLYFLVLLLAALGERLELIALGGVAVSGAYLYLLTASGNWSMWSSPSIIRIPFLATAAFFYGYLVDRTHHQRRRADTRTEELRDEAQVSSSLLCVARDMISSLEQPVIIGRLCQVTAAVLGADSSHTLLWDAKDRVFVPLPGHGELPEQAEAMRLVQIPVATLADLIAALEAEEVVSLTPPPPPLAAALGLPAGGSFLCMALRSGGDLIGIHTAAIHTNEFSPLQRRIAHGIAQSASMALSNARLFSELEKANRIKADFVATMSHELRTPLNQIIGYTDLLLEDGFGPLAGEQSSVLRRVSRSASDLYAMIQATLDLSRLEARDVELSLQTVDPAEVLRAVDVETHQLQGKPGLTFEWRAPAGAPPLCTDLLKLKMVLKNLVANAVKFTDRGKVSVAAELRGNGVEFSVSDTGPGIAERERDAIFEAFRQGEGDVGRPGGVGLGLYIVRRLVDLLGGTVTLESEVGRGSTFRIWLASLEDGERDAGGSLARSQP